MTVEMRVLSIRQPWAFLICAGERTVETRTWSTSYRGLVAIHAPLYRGGINAIEFSVPTDNVFAFGRIIGVAELYDVLPCEGVHAAKVRKALNCLQFRNARLFNRPVRLGGKVGLCRLSPAITAEVENRMSDSVKVDVRSDLRDVLLQLTETLSDDSTQLPNFRVY